VPIRVTCRRTAAAVEVGGKTVARSDGGVVLVVLNKAGQVVERTVAAPEDGLRVPFNRRAFPAYRLVAGPECDAVGNRGWVDVSERARGGRLLLRIDDYAPYDAQIELELEDAGPLAPRLAETAGRGRPSLEVGRQTAGVTRATLLVNDAGEFAVMAVDLGGAPRRARVRAHVDRDEARRALVCSMPLGGRAFFESDEQQAALLPLGREGEAYFGPGWHGPERDGPLDFRWTAASEAAVLLPLARTYPLGVRLALSVPPERGETWAELILNGTPLGRHALRPGWQSVEWSAPASAWVAGLNTLRVRSALGKESGGRALGVAISQIRLTRH